MERLIRFLQSREFIVSIALLGGTVGAAGWILGAGLELFLGGRATDARSVLLCAAGVFATGVVVWLTALMGRTMNVLVVTEALLAASVAFGVAALAIMRAHGVVAFAVDSSGTYSEWFAYAAPIAILVIMAGLWWGPWRGWLERVRI